MEDCHEVAQKHLGVEREIGEKRRLGSDALIHAAMAECAELDIQRIDSLKIAVGEATVGLDKPEEGNLDAGKHLREVERKRTAVGVVAPGI